MRLCSLIFLSFVLLQNAVAQINDTYLTRYNEVYTLDGDFAVCNVSLGTSKEITISSNSNSVVGYDCACNSRDNNKTSIVKNRVTLKVKYFIIISLFKLLVSYS